MKGSEQYSQHRIDGYENDIVTIFQFTQDKFIDQCGDVLCIRNNYFKICISRYLSDRITLINSYEPSTVTHHERESTNDVAWKLGDFIHTKIDGNFLMTLCIV